MILWLVAANITHSKTKKIVHQNDFHLRNLEAIVIDHCNQWNLSYQGARKSIEWFLFLFTIRFGRMVTPFNKYFCFANLPLEEQQIYCWTEMLNIIFYVDWYLNSQKACCVQPCPLSLFGNFGKFSNYTLIIFCFPFFVCVLLLFSWLLFNHGDCEQHIFPRAAGVRRHYNICAKHFELFSIKAIKLTQINNRAFPIARWEKPRRHSLYNG